MKDLNIILMGLGAVGKGVVKSISIKKEIIKSKYGVNLNFVAVADSTSSAISQNSLDEELLLVTKEKNGNLADYPEFGTNKNGIEVLDSVDYDLLVEATPTNIVDGQPAKSLTLKAFRDGKDVVTSNKGHLALFFSQMNKEAIANNVEF
jgi:homoserine dehydrogenase